ncbi:cytochrome o ubiquinol oxidase subunit III [Raoultella terrigena]|uniref:cytochrome o ubiquinol oxidase subunit III n=1 Tax=Raoultella terrigena TaxID=577 RepID=UPI0013303B02|nr:cytochrome o ubiquinol oxidase subunit III [Raoultella terrigena]MCI1030906.1 cytochrome o ubiquinol oxidase subunit III [Raoultella terrigena]
MSSHTLAPAAGHEAQGHDDGSAQLGLWIYLMSDCILFGSIFATYAVLSSAFADALTPKELFEIPYVLTETFMLLLSSITYGFVMLALRRHNRTQVLLWLAVTFAFGAVFIGMELFEFHHLIAIHAGPDKSAWLSAFFTLVGTHGLHVTFGLIWMAVLFHQVLTKGIGGKMPGRLSCLSLFWHFLDLVWICVFTVVYLLGVY